jgi:hypothetical protein
MGVINTLKNRFLGSDTDVTKPDFDNSPWFELDLCKTKIKLKHARHTAMYPIFEQPVTIDYSDERVMKRQSDGSLAKQVYDRGWELKGRGGRSLGGVSVTIVVLNEGTRNSGVESLFKPAELRNEVINYCHSRYGWQNDSEKVGDIGDSYFMHPVRPDQLGIHDDWVTFTAGVEGAPAQFGFAKTIEYGVFISIRFDVSAYDGTDYYSPETNIKEVSEAIIEQFMANVTVELSPQAQAQKKQALLTGEI